MTKNSRKQRGNFLVIHGAVNGPLRYLESVDMYYGKHGTRLCRVNVLVSVPGAGYMRSVCKGNTSSWPLTLR